MSKFKDIIVKGTLRVIRKIITSALEVDDLTITNKINDVPITQYVVDDKLSKKMTDLSDDINSTIEKVSDTKVDKEDGKGLSTEDFTTEYKEMLNSTITKTVTLDEYNQLTDYQSIDNPNVISNINYKVIYPDNTGYVYRQGTTAINPELIGYNYSDTYNSYQNYIYTGTNSSVILTNRTIHGDNTVIKNPNITGAFYGMRKLYIDDVNTVTNISVANGPADIVIHDSGFFQNHHPKCENSIMYITNSYPSSNLHIPIGCVLDYNANTYNNSSIRQINSIIIGNDHSGYQPIVNSYNINIGYHVKTINVYQTPYNGIGLSSYNYYHNTISNYDSKQTTIRYYNIGQTPGNYNDSSKYNNTVIPYYLNRSLYYNTFSMSNTNIIANLQYTCYLYPSSYNYTNQNIYFDLYTTGLFPWIDGKGTYFNSRANLHCEYYIDALNLISHPNIRSIHGLIEFGHQMFNLIGNFNNRYNSNANTYNRSSITIEAPYRIIRNALNVSDRLYYLYPYYSNQYSSRLYINLYEKIDDEMICHNYASLFTNPNTDTFSICNANSAVINLYGSLINIPNNIVISNISDLKINTSLWNGGTNTRNYNIQSLSIYNCNITSSMYINDDMTSVNLYNIRSNNYIRMWYNARSNWQSPEVRIGDCSLQYIEMVIPNIRNVTITNLNSRLSINTYSSVWHNKRPPLNLYLSNISDVEFTAVNNRYNTGMRNTFNGRTSIDIYISSTMPMTHCKIPYDTICTDNKNVPVNLSYEFVMDESSDVQLPIPIEYCNIRSTSSNVILGGNNLYHHNEIINSRNSYSTDFYKSIYKSNWYLPYFNGGICMTVLSNITEYIPWSTGSYTPSIVNISMNNVSSILRDSSSNVNDSYGFFGNLYVPNCSYIGKYALSGHNWIADGYSWGYSKIQLGNNVVIDYYAFNGRTIDTIRANSIETIMPFAFNSVTYYHSFDIIAPINTICGNAFSNVRCWMDTGGGSNPYNAPFSEYGLDAKYIGPNILYTGIIGLNNSKLSNRTLKLINTIRLDDYALYGANYYNLSLPNTLQYANMPYFNNSINNISVEPDFNCNLNMIGANCNSNVIYNIFTNLATLPSITKTFTLGSTQLSRCNAATKAIATQKNWTLA